MAIKDEHIFGGGGGRPGDVGQGTDFTLIPILSLGFRQYDKGSPFWEIWITLFHWIVETPNFWALGSSESRHIGTTL